MNGILSGALTSLQANTTAMKVVSQNISNLNTQNYARRVVDFSPLGAAGAPVGVTIQDIRRVSDQYLAQEALSATSASNQYDVQTTTFNQINSLLGSPGDGQALTTKLQGVFSALNSAQLSSTSSVSQGAVVNKMKSLASSISSLSSQLDNLANQADGQLTTAVSQANTLIKQIYDYNQLIKTASVHGNSDTVYLDQRASALNSLAQMMDLRVAPQDDGSVLVTTQDGMNLVSDSYASLSYAGGKNGVYGTIQAQDTNGATGNPIGSVQSLDSHLTSGSMRGLIDMRDTTIAGLKNELGSFAKTVANSFNAVHNENSAYPAPSTMDGRDTGLLASDSLNFSGKTTITLTDSSGAAVGSAAIDFGAGTITTGAGTFNFTNSIGSFTNNLNSALSSVSPGASASFADGQLSLDGGAHGLVITNPVSATPGQRGGTNFSQFFGLNDVFSTSLPSISATGMSGSDALNLASNGTIDLVLKNASGDIASKVSVNITAGMTVNQALTAINTALGSSGSLSLNADGSVSTALSSKLTSGGYQLQVASDTTSRGTTGVSFSQLFGIGANTLGQQSVNFSVKDAVLSDPSRLALCRPATTGTQIISPGDTKGLLALQALTTSKQSFDKAGTLAAQTASLGDYASGMYQDIATKSADAASNKTTQADRLTEAQNRMANQSGVNLDEELSNMIIYQRSYSASARLLNTVSDLYDVLLSIK
nr:flagellar hook-associated protein FlgK [Rhizomicrobium palustre]